MGISNTDCAAMFKALGDPTRLAIYNFLRQQCTPVSLAENGDVRTVSGPTVGEVCCRVTGAEGITSTISHHIKELRLAGLITVNRQGKQMICRICPQALESLINYLTEAPTGAACCNEKEHPNG